MIFLDTSALIGSLCGTRTGWGSLRRLVQRGEPLRLSSLVLYEWYRGIHTEPETSIRETLFPDEAAVAFTREDAKSSGLLYRGLPRARGRAFDIAIAACAIRREAAVWTLNQRDFADIPGLRLADPESLE